ncbi:MAG TPA: lysophospholipid acyltransferase family protein [Thermotogota bacterium]|nr:lysophospholipid acyltransferase family protein [Thermotogota bacterium]
MLFQRVRMGVLFSGYVLYSFFVFAKAERIRKTKGKEAWQSYVRPKVQRFCRRSFYWLGMKPEIRHTERLPRTGAYLLIANHQSFFDVNVVLGFLSPKAFLMAKREFQTLPFFGTAVNQVGYFIDRKDPKQAINALRKAIEHLKEGVPFALFPEGTRSTDGEMNPFQKNSLKLAYIAKVPIVPVVIEGTQYVMPKGSFFAVKAQVTVEILEPIHPHDYPDEERLNHWLFTTMQAKKKEMENEKSIH